MTQTSFYLFITIALIIGLLAGYILTNIKFQKRLTGLKDRYQKEKDEFFESIDDLNRRLAAQQIDFEKEKHVLKTKHLQELNDNDKLVSQLKLQLQNWEEKWHTAQEEFEQKNKLMHKEFELLAQRILEEKSKKFTELNHSKMTDILMPFQEAMKAFKERVEQTEKDSIGRHHALKEQLTELQKLNRRLSEDALNLTKALKGDSKTQGIWGETILNRLLEKSGLEKGREYFVQQSFKAVEGTNRQRVQPDVIIQLPDQKSLVIDAKVSLTAYERYINADDENQQEAFLKQHLTSLKAHINGLTKKAYDELLQGESPEFILMFIAVEPAFSLALKEDPELYNYAFERNIVMVTPSTLLATLKIVDNMWRNEKQRKNAIEIATRAGALYDKFHSFIVDMEQIGHKLSSAQQTYSTAMNKLQTGKGNLISRVQKLKELGAKAKKQLDLPEDV